MIVKTTFSKSKDILFTKYDENNNELGYGCLIVHERPDGKGCLGLIEDIYTHPQYRKTGVASQIIEEIQIEAKRLGLYKLVLQCSNDNIKLYEKFGFKINQNAMRWSVIN